MTYGFTLNWEELPEELREQKITDFLDYLTPEEKVNYSRYDAEEHIRAHFPIYF